MHLAKCLKKYSANKFCFFLGMQQSLAHRTPTQKGPLPLRVSTLEYLGCRRNPGPGSPWREAEAGTFGLPGCVFSPLMFSRPLWVGFTKFTHSSQVSQPWDTSTFGCLFDRAAAFSLGQRQAELGQLSWQAAVWSCLLPIPYPIPQWA